MYLVNVTAVLLYVCISPGELDDTEIAIPCDWPCSLFEHDELHSAWRREYCSVSRFFSARNPNQTTQQAG